MSNYTNYTICSHGHLYSEECDKCELVTLRERMSWMARQVKYDEARYEHLMAKNKLNWERVGEIKDKP